MLGEWRASKAAAAYDVAAGDLGGAGEFGAAGFALFLDSVGIGPSYRFQIAEVVGR